MDEILCEISARHLHLSQQHLKFLFGDDAVLSVVKNLSQGGEFLSDKRVTIVGSKKNIDNVAVLGPLRPQTQVELSTTDCIALGVKAPLRLSGDLEASAGCVIKFGDKELEIKEGVIVAKRHIHLTPEWAEKKGYENGEIVACKFNGERGGVLKNVEVRIKSTFTNALHLDADDYNAMGGQNKAEILKKTS